MPDQRRRRRKEPPISVRRVTARGDLESVRSLLIEYRNWLAKDPNVMAFGNEVLRKGLTLRDEEIHSLPGPYTPPRGALFLAILGGVPVGCVALHSVHAKVAELRRLYVRPEARGLGLGRRLTQAVLDRARRQGYQRVVLDTLPTMGPAIALYRGMGFLPTEAYWQNPFPDALYFEHRFPKRASPRRAKPRGR